MARIEKKPSATLIEEADCLLVDEVGAWVYVTGPRIAGRLQVSTGDPSSTVKVPAIGIIMEKLTGTTAKVQLSGVLSAVVTGLTSGKVCYVGLDGKTTQVAPSAPNYIQPVAVATNADEVLINPDFPEAPLPSYSSHYNTTDGATNPQVPDVLTEYRGVSNPLGHFDIGDWVAGTTYPATRMSPLQFSTAPEVFSILDLTTTFRARVYGADGLTVLAENSIVLTGDGVTIVDNITIEIAGWAAELDRYVATAEVTIDLAAILPDGGRFSVEIQHQDGALLYQKTQSDVFYDHETNAASLTGVTIVETAGFAMTRFLSGVEYYTVDSFFTVGIADIDNLNDESYPLDIAYHQPQIDIDGSSYGLGSLVLGGTVLTGWTDDWNNVNASYQKTDWNIQQLNLTVRGLVAIQARTKDWTDGPWVGSADAALLIETHFDVNTRLVERFYSEDWRCQQTADFDLPNARGWTSSNDKGPTDALFFGGGVEHNQDDWGAYSPNPTSQPNYSAHTGMQYFIREFQHDGSASSGFTLNIPGGVVPTSLEFKLGKAWDGTPTGGTVWVDGLAAYSAAQWNNGNPLGGSGGKVGTSDYTFGTNNIVNCSNTLYVRIGFDPADRIEGPISVVFS